jgi:CRISPR/Cas system CMR-associated protein Cmr1 (group 7 of RAMP superfamily)
MEALILKGTNETPNVVFNKQTGEFSISGKSLPEDVKEFYKPLLDWITVYSKSPNPETKLKVKMDYFNTASSKMILEIFELFKGLQDAGNNVTIDWYYHEEDEDMQEAGEDYADIVEVPFNIISHQRID